MLVKAEPLVYNQIMGTSMSGAYAGFLKEGGPILKILVSLVYIPRSSPVAPCGASMTYSPDKISLLWRNFLCFGEYILTKFCLNKILS